MRRAATVGSGIGLGLFASVLVLLGSEGKVHAGPILGTMATYDSIQTVQPNSNTSLSVLFAIGPIADHCFNLGACPQIALLQGIDSSAAGMNFTLDSSSPNFAGVVSKLTNGVLDYISTGVVPGPSYALPGGGAGFPETNFGTSPDFAGETISSLVVHIDDVIIQPSAVTPGTEFRVDFTLTVFAVPEPATACTLAIGLGAFIALQRRLRNRGR